MKRALYIIGMVIGLAIVFAGCDSHVFKPEPDIDDRPPTIDPPVNEFLRNEFKELPHEAIDAKLQMRTPALRTTKTNEN